jgi:hypothetical protein
MYLSYILQKLIQILSMLSHFPLRLHLLIALGREKPVRQSGQVKPTVEVSVST